MSSLVTLSAGIIFASILPAAQAHMALWSPAAYGFAQPYEPVTPLAGLSFEKWWFHGNAADSPTETIQITAGQPLTVEISCDKKYSTYGNMTSVDACPIADFYHAGGTGATGWAGNSETNLKGCALAISPTANAALTKPEDFTVMSVLANCVRNRDTVFLIPANLPDCPAGGCTCAWFWLTGRDEMYMTGFKCDVAGGTTAPFPKSMPPQRGAIKGPTQPIYWGNDMPNIGYTPDETNRPTYTATYGWEDGAQSAAFDAPAAGGDGEGEGGDVPVVVSPVVTPPIVDPPVAAPPTGTGGPKICTKKAKKAAYEYAKRSRVFQAGYVAGK